MWCKQVGLLYKNTCIGEVSTGTSRGTDTRRQVTIAKDPIPAAWWVPPGASCIFFLAGISWTLPSTIFFQLCWGVLCKEVSPGSSDWMKASTLPWNDLWLILRRLPCQACPFLQQVWQTPAKVLASQPWACYTGSPSLAVHILDMPLHRLPFLRS